MSTPPASDALVALLPPDWSWHGKKVLRLHRGKGQQAAADGATVVSHPVTPLERYDPSDGSEQRKPIQIGGRGTFDVVHAIDVFPHLSLDWADWLSEAHALLKPDGVLIASVIGSGEASRYIDVSPTEDEVGMNVVEISSGASAGVVVAHSRWWIEAHWGRAFEVLDVRPGSFVGWDGGTQTGVLLRRRDANVDPAELERLERDEPREWRTWRANLEQLTANVREYGVESSRIERYARAEAAKAADPAPALTGLRSDAPMPPLSLAERVGHHSVSRDWAKSFDSIGARRAEWIRNVIPGGSLEGKRVLDFGCGVGRVLRHLIADSGSAEIYGTDVDERSIEWVQGNLCPPLHAVVGREDPPLPFEDNFFDYIYAYSVFTHITANWSAWILDIHRVLAPGGLFLPTFRGPGVTRAAVLPYREDKIGMNVTSLGEPSGVLGRGVQHSQWWIEQHWGRLFDIVDLKMIGADGRTSKGQGYVLLRKKDVQLSIDDVEAIDPEEPREVAARYYNIGQLMRVEQRPFVVSVWRVIDRLLPPVLSGSIRRRLVRLQRALKQRRRS